MDSYDAILELVKRTQTRGLETVTNRLDFVIESLQELIQEAKSSVQEALPREPEELFPVAEVEAALVAARTASDERAHGLTTEVSELKQRLDRLTAQLEAAERRPTPVPAAAPGPSLDVLRRLDRARSQSELLKELLPLLAEHSGRAVVLVLKGTTMSAWSGIGFADPERLRSWHGEVAASGVLDRFAREAVPIRFTPSRDPLLSRWLAGEAPSEEALLVPVCLRGKVMGGVYLDQVGGRPWQPEQAQVLVATTCWLIDTLAYRQTVPSPLLAETLDLLGGAEPAVAEETGAEPLPVEEEAAVVEAAEATPAVAAEPAPGASLDPSATVRVELREVQPVVPPPAVEPVEVPPVERPLTPEEQGKHDEARRFARLLVSEIKLYNEDEVERGRVSKDLYHRLKEDIDRSREMYEKRIPAEIRSARDYFHEELLRILADGDPDALGM